MIECATSVDIDRPGASRHPARAGTLASPCGHKSESGDPGVLAAEAEPPLGHLNRRGVLGLTARAAVVVQGEHRGRDRYVRLPGDHAFGLRDHQIKLAGVRIDVTRQIQGPFAV